LKTYQFSSRREQDTEQRLSIIAETLYVPLRRSPLFPALLDAIIATFSGLSASNVSYISTKTTASKEARKSTTLCTKNTASNGTASSNRATVEVSATLVRGVEEAGEAECRTT
jgi:hypothetical protein